MDDHFAILQAALDYTANLKGKPRDRAIFDYLCGAAKALHIKGAPTDCPPWLWVIGVQGGNRVSAIQRLLAK